MPKLRLQTSECFCCAQLIVQGAQQGNCSTELLITNKKICVAKCCFWFFTLEVKHNPEIMGS